MSIWVWCGGLAVICFFLTVLLGRPMINYLKRDKLSQTEREYGPQSHLKKSGTPTFGGVIFLLPFFILSAIVLMIIGATALLPTILFIFVMSCIGFCDDYVKVKINQEGLSPRAKSIPMLVAICIYVLYELYGRHTAVVMALPFTTAVWQIDGLWKILYALALVIYFYAVINAVNLTDGVDGLLSAVTLPILCVCVLLIGTLKDGHHLHHPKMLVVIFALIGALLGFLCFNRHPAQVFMGDTGSLGIGAAVGVLAFYIQRPWLILFAGCIYVAEAGSVVLQVAYFKRTGGKRIFRMSPIHHHYELGGWSEKKVVWRFVLVTILGCVLGVLSCLPSLLA